MLSEQRGQAQALPLVFGPPNLIGSLRPTQGSLTWSIGRGPVPTLMGRWGIRRILAEDLEAVLCGIKMDGPVCG